MQKSVRFAKKNFKITIYKVRNIVRDYCHYLGKYRGAAHRISNLKDISPKKVPKTFHNGSDYDYDFIIK